VNLHMMWNCFLSGPVSPDIMPLTVSQKPPSKLLEDSFQLSPPDVTIVHLCVYILKNCFTRTLWAPQLVKQGEGFHSRSLQNDARPFSQQL
jgi:hypothetical protein